MEQESTIAPSDFAEQQDQSIFRRLYSSPYTFTAATFVAVLTVAFGYMDRYLEPRLDRQADDIRDANVKLDKFISSFQDYRVSIAEKETLAASTRATLAGQINSSQSHLSEIKEQLAKLAVEIKASNSAFQTQFANLQKAIEYDIKTVAEKTNTTEKKMEEQLANMPEAERMVSQLDEQKTAIANNDHGVNILKALVQLGIEHPLQQSALQTIAESNPEFSEKPELLTAFWESKKDFTNANFAEYIQKRYAVSPTDAMLLAYNELTETKPIRYFIAKQEIQSNAEPIIGGARPQTEESDVPLARPLTIARVCAEMKKPRIECYNYFINLTEEISDDIISFESPSDNAVMKLIVDKHESKIPNK